MKMFFYTDPFRKVLLSEHETKVRPKAVKNFTHIFKVKAPLLKKNEIVCFLGDAPIAGKWNTDAPLLFSLEGDWWTAKLNMPKETFPLLYKYGVYNVKDKTFVRFEVAKTAYYIAMPTIKN